MNGGITTSKLKIDFSVKRLSVNIQDCVILLANCKLCLPQHREYWPLGLECDI